MSSKETQTVQKHHGSTREGKHKATQMLCRACRGIRCGVSHPRSVPLSYGGVGFMQTLRCWRCSRSPLLSIIIAGRKLGVNAKSPVSFNLVHSSVDDALCCFFRSDNLRCLAVFAVAGTTLYMMH